MEPSQKHDLCETKKNIKGKNSDSFNYREKLWLHGSVCINIVQLLSLCMTQREVDTQGCRKVWKSGRALINVVGIIVPPGWDRVNWSAKYWRHVTPPPAPLVPTSLYQHMTHLLLTVQKLHNLKIQLFLLSPSRIDNI